MLLGPCHSGILLAFQVHHQTGKLGSLTYIQVQGAGWDQVGIHATWRILCGVGRVV